MPVRSPLLKNGKWRVLLLGFGFAFFSTFGQTPFIAPFGGALRHEFGLTHGTFGAVYSGATLTSGVLIAKVGGLIDRWPLRRYALAAVLGLGLGVLAVPFVANAALLAACLFFLRLFGHGMMDHVAVTAMVRAFHEARGRAVAIAALGHPIGEALFPVLAVLVAGAFGWRVGWVAAGAICLLVAWPLRCLTGPAQGDGRRASGAPFSALAFVARREMLLALPAVTASGFISTAMLFHQVPISEAKGWPLYLFPSAMAVFAAFHIAAALGAGWLVDRFGARRPAIVHILPIGLGCLALSAFDKPVALFVYMALAGVSNGAIMTIAAPLLAEAYGTEQIGAIRATVRAATIISSSLSPLLIGLLLDAGVGVDVLTLTLGLLAVAAALMLRASDLASQVRSGAGQNRDGP